MRINASSGTGAPTASSAGVHHRGAGRAGGLAPTLLNQGSNDMVDADNPVGVDGLATQGQTNVTQDANPNLETNPIAGYDFGYRAANQDYGDLPDTGTGTGSGNYQTLASDGGAAHTIVSGVYLGTGVDPDGGTLQNATATLDDTTNTGSVDDEDGVVFLNPLMPGRKATIQVTASVAGCLNAWVDWNGNGVLTDAGEPIAANLAVNSGPNIITINPVPATTGVVYSRFRFTQTCGQGGNNPTGSASSGEVEDYALAALGDFVWADNNLNGLQDLGEPGVAGATVKLLRADLTPVKDADNNDITTVTDGNGKYEFPGLPAGDYRVQFVKPAGGAYSSFTTARVGADPAIDSDASPANGSSPAVTLGAGQVNTTLDAGLVTSSVQAGKLALGNVLWCDNGLNGGTVNDGVKQPTEPGLPGVAVRLYGLGTDNTPYTGDDVLVKTTTTATDGTYYFTGITPGSYYVAVASGTVPSSCGQTATIGGGGEPNTPEPATTNKGVSGTGNAAGLVVSAVLNASLGGAAAHPESTEPLGYATADSYLTVDFGFATTPTAVTLSSLSASRNAWLDSLMRNLAQFFQVRR